MMSCPQVGNLNDGNSQSPPNNSPNIKGTPLRDKKLRPLKLAPLSPITPPDKNSTPPFPTTTTSNVPTPQVRRRTRPDCTHTLNDDVIRILTELRLSQDTALAAYKASVDSALLTLRSDIANAVTCHRTEINDLAADTGEQIKALHNGLESISDNITTNLQGLRQESRTGTVPKLAAELRKEIGREFADIRSGIREDLDWRFAEVRERLATGMAMNGQARRGIQTRKRGGDADVDAATAVLNTVGKNAGFLSDGGPVYEALTDRAELLLDMQGRPVCCSVDNLAALEERVKVLEDALREEKEITSKTKAECQRLGEGLSVLLDEGPPRGS